MPELPEVETVRRSLEPKLVGRTILSLQIHYGGIIKKPEPSELAESIKGQRIERLDRRGKYLLFELSDEKTLVVHLRMTGRLTVEEAGSPLAKHTHLVFSLDNGRELRFNDVRKFGMVYLLPGDDYQAVEVLYTLGPEPLSGEFTAAELLQRLQRKKIKLKTFLLDQKEIAGLGNIYADEAMFRAGLHPERITNGISEAEASRLHQAIQKVLQEGIEYRGTTFRDYVDGNGAKGRFQERLKVYGRAGKECECGAILQKKTVAGRTTVYCPHCQK
mgnify:CR=1 FL=1